MMILSAFVGASLLTLVAGTPGSSLDSTVPSSTRREAVQPYITRATECVARSVASDPRSRDASKLTSLIVDSMHSCRDSVRSMIETYDEFYGDGTGEAFFAGPYLDVLPAAVTNWVAHGQR